VISLLLASSLPVRAESTPANPLRRKPEPAIDVWATPPPQTTPVLLQAQAVADLPPPEPQSVVPPNLGQPGELPTANFRSPPVLQEDWPLEGLPDGSQHGSLMQPWFGHTDPNDPCRHIGLGVPLVGTSWRNRPIYFGYFVGGILAEDLIAGHVQQNNGAITGFRLGWDFDHFWGVEFRYAYFRVNLADGNGLPLDDSHNSLIDVSLLYYPLGDARWRPYLGAGLGFGTFRFYDDRDRRINDSLLTIPLGVGLKYYYSNAFTLRIDAFDNLSFGDHTLDTMHNFSLTVGAEIRFGGQSPSYFPWHGNTTIW